jgi:hypothetical protein
MISSRAEVVTERHAQLLHCNRRARTRFARAAGEPYTSPDPEVG